ncbi:hypothetical protein J0X14_14430 [Muricauda sp. CAU 1633]|uniref:hypothetical protein n=1 Tax=Allomuricauda sp. CAU 1633 TaxID=2816036 RepID=UPI001A8DF832|nr:hypothetical protein [Muricauda sp. CAU 1633]MBO0323502.1 hypothetical protein [Muricauda sp. CAU 1633]
MSIQNYIANLDRCIDGLRKYAVSGDIQPHEAYALIKESGIDERLGSCISEIRGVAVDGLKHNYLEGNEKNYKSNGYAFTVRSGSTRYYFTDVPEVKEKKILAESTEEWKGFKASEHKYKTAFLMKQKNMAMFDEETGEEVDVSSVKVVYSPDTLSVKKIEKELV